MRSAIRREPREKVYWKQWDSPSGKGMSQGWLKILPSVSIYYIVYNLCPSQ